MCTSNKIVKTRRNQLIRIALIGAHGCGKTSLAKKLAEYFKSPYIPEQARISQQKLNIDNLDELRKDKRMFMTFQLDILTRQIDEEMKLQKTGFISDRSTCDNVCYMLLNNDSCEKVVYCYKHLALTHYETCYDFICYVPIMFPLEDDGVRNKGEKYRQEVDKLIQKYMVLNPNLYILKSEGLENRVKELIEVIKNWKIK